MSLATSIYNALRSSSAVVAIVGATGVYPVTTKQGATAPYVIFNGIASDPAATHGEASGANSRLVQFACFAATFEQADALRAAVVAALDNVSVGNGEGTGILEDDSRDDYDAAARLYRCDCDLIF